MELGFFTAIWAGEPPYGQGTIEADRRLAAPDLGDCAATGDPRGRS
jgi:hypothetical protein